MLKGIDMNRRKFLGITGAAIAASGCVGYLLSDKHNFIRADIKDDKHKYTFLNDDDREIIYLASLAPSGHNTQPWIVTYLEPYHWIIENDNSKWLPAVDPNQRETILSIGAFMQNLEYAAGSFGYDCEYNVIAKSNQDRHVLEVRLKKASPGSFFDTRKIKLRRTVRSGYMNLGLKSSDVKYLIGNQNDYFQFISKSTKEYHWLNEKTIEANRHQSNRDDAQSELADWMRFSSKDAMKYCDGLTTGSMEIDGIPGWVVRNFYDKQMVMSKDFREQGLDKVKRQVSSSGGWIIITSKDNSTATLIETGMRLQRMLLKTRERNIAVHPMTQILEEAPYNTSLNSALGIRGEVQFILRTGYIMNYPDPVSLRRPVEKIVKFYSA